MRHFRLREELPVDEATGKEKEPDRHRHGDRRRHNRHDFVLIDDAAVVNLANSTPHGQQKPVCQVCTFHAKQRFAKFLLSGSWFSVFFIARTSKMMKRFKNSVCENFSAIDQSFEAGALNVDGMIFYGKRGSWQHQIYPASTF